MASLWSRLRESLRERFSAIRWVEPSNEITRAVLLGPRVAAVPGGPIYARDERDLVFTVGELLDAAPPAVAGPQAAPQGAADASPASAPGRTAPRRAGRAA